MKNIFRTFVCLFFFSGISLVMDGQDLHYSQFYNAPQTVNPAFTGIFNGDQRIMASYRDQWRSVPVPWQTASLAYDQKFYPGWSEKGFFGGGLYFNYDRQGDSKLNLININLSGSYTRLLNTNNAVTLGVALGYASRGFDLDGLRWDNGWNGEFFDPSLGSGENFTFERFGYLETALGINYRWQKSSRTKIDLGVGAFHLTQPDAKFYDRITNENLPLRLAFSGVGTVQLTDKLDLQLDVLYQDQRTYDELLLGGYLNVYLNEQRGRETQVRFGAGYRTSQSLYPKVGVEYRNIFVAFSYDIDLSEFNQATNNKGGPEIHVRYIIRHVKPGKFKICPIF